MAPGRRRRWERHGLGGLVIVLATPELALADEDLEQRDDRQHDENQGRRIGDRQTIIAVFDTTNDIGRGHVMFGGNKKNDRADGCHGPHEKINKILKKGNP